MKISCFLTSFNRPSLVRRALESVASQDWENYELFVLDESDVFDVKEAVKEFEFRCPTHVRLHTYTRTPAERAKKNPMSAKLNAALPDATGDVVCFLCDDDYYYPRWFTKVALHFTEHPESMIGYGMLRHEKYGAVGPTGPVKDPLRVLDHNQVVHRRLVPPCLFPESMDKELATAPDGYYFRAVTERFGGRPIDPIDALAAVKGHHQKTWLKTFGKGPIEGLREG